MQPPRPKVILLMALTVDGRSGLNADHFPDWTGAADKRMFKSLSQKAGVVIMGSRTFDTIGKPLPGRLNVVMSRNPDRVSQHPDLRFTDQTAAEVLQMIGAAGYSEAILAGGATINDLFITADLVDELVITYAPLTFGQGLGLYNTMKTLRLSLLAYRALDPHTLMVHYCVEREGVAEDRSL
ncbi:MAG: dihydrofolate reductase family protein [Desulfosarcinaceae bacterium]|nr:dihydrofolate reductase family protein [Desulfosarcinaceae bacterium]